jgi:hypothetical protein
MSDSPEIIIRLAEPGEAPALARLRYEFRAGQDPATEDESHFLARCGAWMAARLTPGSHWRRWVVGEPTKVMKFIRRSLCQASVTYFLHRPHSGLFSTV